ncbi:metallophosphoesterase family protein [uncultured Roseovarius sp.]|uniref:metallophosphoesterase family protein n=1 Tax=uncultured Roseovarius sp. TaxID=293344 RepID=UPI002623AB53|nr:metallophosphoesterase family protein [uncultured Roseovarius sp.]
MTRPIYVIPDIHGQLALLDEALARIETDGGADAKVVFLGDYVDRGPDSRGVIETLIAGQAAGRDWITLRGNHDQMFLDFLDQGTIDSPRLSKPGYSWQHHRLGGVETLASYGVTASADTPRHPEALRAVPSSHRDWLAGLPLYHLAGEVLFLHAGIKPGLPLDQQDGDDLMWIRNEFHKYRKPHPWLIVHGHTPVDFPTHFGNRIDLDGGAGWGRALWPAVFEGRDCWLLTETGREPLIAG